MVSDAQQQANEENAKLGGVKTEEGKAISRFNAQKHGILRESITNYEQDFYVEFFDELMEQYRPANITEKILVERVALCYLKLFRVQRTETEFMKARLDPHIEKVASWIDMTDALKGEVVNEGYIPKLTSDDVLKLMSTYSRYETTLENRLYKALHELERQQRLRKGDVVPAPVAVDVGIEKMGSFSEIA